MPQVLIHELERRSVIWLRIWYSLVEPRSILRGRYTYLRSRWFVQWPRNNQCAGRSPGNAPTLGYRSTWTRKQVVVPLSPQKAELTTANHSQVPNTSLCLTLILEDGEWVKDCSNIGYRLRMRVKISRTQELSRINAKGCLCLARLRDAPCWPPCRIHTTRSDRATFILSSFVKVPRRKPIRFRWHNRFHLYAHGHIWKSATLHLGISGERLS